MNLHGPVRPSDAAGVGDAVVRISLDSWPEGLVAPTTHTISVVRSKGHEAPLQVSSRFIRSLVHPERKATVTQVLFSPDGARLFTAGWPSGILQLWDLATGKEIRRINTPPGRRFTYQIAEPTADWSLVYVPLERQTVTKIGKGEEQELIVYDGEILVFDLATGQPRPPLKPPPGFGVLDCTVSPDGQRLVATERMSRLRNEPNRYRTVLWDTRTRTARPLGDGAGGAAFSPDSQRLALCCNDSGQPSSGVLKLFDTGNELAELATAKGEWLHSPKFSPDGWQLSVQQSANRHATLRVFEIATRREYATLKSGGHVPFSDYCLAPEGGRIAATDFESGRVRIWDLATGKPILDKLFEKELESRHSAFSPDGRRLALLGQPKWDRAEFGSDPDPRDLPQPRVCLFDLTKAAAEPEIIMCPHGWPGALAFSPDGKLLAVGGAGATHLFDVSK